MSKKKITDAVEIMDRRFRKVDPNWDEAVVEEEMKARVAIAAYKIRDEAGLTQVELAGLVGTTQSIISRLEHGDYEGSALDMLWRICMVLHKHFHFSCEEPARNERESSCTIELTPA